MLTPQGLCRGCSLRLEPSSQLRALSPLPQSPSLQHPHLSSFTATLYLPFPSPSTYRHVTPLVSRLYFVIVFPPPGLQAPQQQELGSRLVSGTGGRGAQHLLAEGINEWIVAKRHVLCSNEMLAEVGPLDTSGYPLKNYQDS